MTTKLGLLTKLTVVFATGILLLPAAVFAHVIVTPSQTGIGKELIFNVSVPNEQQTPVVNLKLAIPNGVMNVVPTAKVGWIITTSDNGDSKNPITTAITWSAGSIPVGQRDDFTFSAQVPANPTELDWKAYQTYGDGTVVHWDQKPAGSDDSTGNAGPYSVTKVVNDLTATPTGTTTSSTNSAVASLIFGLVAIVISIYGVSKTKTFNKK